MKDLQSEYSPARVRFEYPQYKTKSDFKPEYRFFITEDEIDKLLLNGSSTSGGKFRIEEFFKQEHTAKEIADSIKSFFPDTDIDLLTTAIQSYKDIDAWNETPVLKQESFDKLQEVMSLAGELKVKAPYDKIVNNKYAQEVIK